MVYDQKEMFYTDREIAELRWSAAVMGFVYGVVATWVSMAGLYFLAVEYVQLVD